MRSAVLDGADGLQPVSVCPFRTSLASMQTGSLCRIPEGGKPSINECERAGLRLKR